MATGGGDGSLALILKDFEHWLEATPDAQIFLLQVLLTLHLELVNVHRDTDMLVGPSLFVFSWFSRFGFVLE